MLGNQLLVEMKRAFTIRNLLIWMGIIILLPAIRFYTIKEGYQFFEPIEVFQEMVSTIIPLLFPAIIIIIYLPLFLQELRNNFVLYTRPRIPLNTYLLSKIIVNAFLTGGIVFLLIFLPFIFVVYLEPHLGIIFYSPKDANSVIPMFTFSQLLEYGNLAYGLTFSLWVSINAVIYSSIALLLMLVLTNPFVALSVPFLFYHIFNFVTGILNAPMFSPLSTIFPFNIVQQPLWTILVPFLFLLIIFIGLFVFTMRKQKEWLM
ncbi:ABC transporter permease [Metalysinibacillus jejuensis]|uniref:ABC transporter permease n=1 Tax=Metalysinibacillus jejuensis TaxID=914327 RepID=UPI000D35EB36|nr:ABC transporter permease [Metalysinibacillus jejuensis]